MGELLSRVAAAAGVFAGTNADDLVVLTVLFLAARGTGPLRVRDVWVGQYGGIALLVAVSAAAALGLAVVPDRWVGLLGLVPLALGVRGLVAAARSRGGDDGAPAVVATGVLSVAGVTIANGGDNVAVYTPLFRTIGPGGALVTVAVFAVLVAAWCAAASWLGSRRSAVALLERHGHWAVPLVFVVIGLVILLESGVVGRVV